MVTLNKAQAKIWLQRYQAVVARKIRRYTWTAMLMTEYMALRGNIGEGLQIRPDIIIAGVPVWHINKLGHAMSDEILKYRSMGGIFLAHQKGGKQTFHFTAKIFGPMRFVTYKLLDGLQLLGSEEARNVKNNLMDIVEVPSLLNADLEYESQKKNALKIDSMVEVGSLGSPFIDFTKQGEFSNEDYAFHRTFPIITETKIYTDMYLETLVARENVSFGRNVIEIECAFRQYTAPLYYHKAIPNDETGKKFYTTFIPKDLLDGIQRNENIMNVLWAAAMTYFYTTGELDPDKIYQKPYGKATWEMPIFIVGMLAHYGISRYSFKNTIYY